jgi:hypothetical protein
MSLPVARPVASITGAQISCIYQPRPLDLPLTTNHKVSHK